MSWFKRKSPKHVLWIATENVNKAKEFQAILKGWEVKTLKDLPEPLEIEESGKTFEENALIKAKALGERTNRIAIGEDSGLKIDKLDGFPGIYSKRWALPETDFHKINEMLLDKMAKAGLTGPDDRDAEFVSAIALYNPRTKEAEQFRGEIGGEITVAPRGDDGFGYDPIFEPFGFTQTFAEMSKDQKNKISHRRIAIHRLLTYLRNQMPGENKWTKFLNNILNEEI